MLMSDWLIRVWVLSQGGLTFGDCPADRLSQARVGMEEVFHGRVPDFEDFSFFQGDDIGRTWLAGKESHFAKKIPFGELGYGTRAAAVRDLNRDATAVNDKH